MPRASSSVETKGSKSWGSTSGSIPGPLSEMVTQSQSVPSRSARAERDGTDWLCVTISDNGPGIDPDVLPQLFEPFVSTELDARGTGLGLAVAEGIVREHEGVILARNRPDRAGAVFEVMLPLPPVSPVDEPEAGDEAQRQTTPGREDLHQ